MIPQATIRQYDRQQEIARVTAERLRRLIVRMGPDFDAGWRLVRGRAVQTVQLGRAAAIHASIPYTSDVLAETGQPGAPVGSVLPAGFMASAPNGLPVEATFDAVPVKAKQAVAGGATVTGALAAAASWAGRAVATMLADTSRDVHQADMIARPQVRGYVRMVSAGACSRCIILAGKWFRWNEGFERHPGCNCRHIPASENVAGDVMTDPYEYFKSLSDAEQDRVFGKANAQAICDGADIFRVENVRMRGMSVAGRDDLVQYAGVRRRTVADIYARDPDRRFVVENLKHHGYITGPQNPDGNIRGNDPYSAILARGRGRGTYAVGGQTVTTARAARYDAVVSGVRDPLNRATMTAAERRLYDAAYRARWADAGYRPGSVGANSADRGLGLRPISPEAARIARETLRKQLAIASDANQSPESVRLLAQLLGY